MSTIYKLVSELVIVTSKNEANVGSSTRMVLAVRL